ncbi:hypothetical protein BH10BAC3_BH10BAC3_17240 [soil metagenome]
MPVHLQDIFNEADQKRHFKFNNPLHAIINKYKANFFERRKNNL